MIRRVIKSTGTVVGLCELGDDHECMYGNSILSSYSNFFSFFSYGFAHFQNCYRTTEMILKKKNFIYEK